VVNLFVPGACPGTRWYLFGYFAPHCVDERPGGKFKKEGDTCRRHLFRHVTRTNGTNFKKHCYGPYKFLYISPERIETSLFQEYLPAFNVNLIAIDEAHCISQWGYDFRPSYLRIAALREYLPGVPSIGTNSFRNRRSTKRYL
jgi:superfamily II DNA helicase RecQ